MGSQAGTLAVPFLRLRHIWQHKETCSGRVEGEAGGAGDEGRMQTCWHEQCCSMLLNRCTRAYTLQQHGTRASLSPSVDAKAFPARPLADSETNKLPGGTAS